MNNTDICNMALSYIGSGKIASLDDDNENARTCKIHYDHQRELTLRNYTWGFANKKVKLAQVDDEVLGWEYIYAYPAQCLALRAIYNKEGADVKDWEKDSYEIVLGNNNVRYICCDVPEAWAECTYDINDAEKFSVDFCEALARGLASAIALPLTGNMSLQSANYQLWQIAVANAKVSNAKEQHKDTHYPSKYFDARS